jgi:hypothetical protein
MGGGKGLTANNSVDRGILLSALIAYPSLPDAKAFIEDHGYGISEAALEVFRKRCAAPNNPLGDEFAAMRRELAPVLEASLADEMLENARYATLVERAAIESVEKRLARGLEKDPATVARNLSMIRTQSIDKRLALQGRPTTIAENRSVDDLVRALEGLGVAKQTVLEAEVVSEEEP